MCEGTHLNKKKEYYGLYIHSILFFVFPTPFSIYPLYVREGIVSLIKINRAYELGKEAPDMQYYIEASKGYMKLFIGILTPAEKENEEDIELVKNLTKQIPRKDYPFGIHAYPGEVSRHVSQDGIIDKANIKTYGLPESILDVPDDVKMVICVRFG